MSMESTNQNEFVRTVPKTVSFRSCSYNEGVDCDDGMFCSTCGWNPFVSLSRIVAKYGEKAGDYLTKPGD